jgi:hypothetical protein
MAQAETRRVGERSEVSSQVLSTQMKFGIEPAPWPMTEEDYELLCECLGSIVIDEAIEEKNNGDQKRQLDKRRGA